jgi:alkanesulfonate monooxygenase SsuD/methylene tetrahydromethanopterin reductase-like flavin-dependent oxidoreductase (luciferase family)
MELEPFQKPHPPFWSGAGTPDGGESAGRIGFNLVANAPTAQVRAITDRYRAAFEGTHTPLLGLARFVIMGETDDEALTIARRAYPLWHKHFHHLFHKHGDAALRPHCAEFHPGRRASLHRTTGSGQRVQPCQLVTGETNARYDIFTNLPATLQARCSATSGCRL